jgi:hypothetical protein
MGQCSRSDGQEARDAGQGDLLSAPVTSWRDSASQQAQDELDGLLNAALPFAQQMLDKNGEFYPYGVGLTDAGDREMLAAPSDDAHPPSDEVLTQLLDDVRQRASSLRAVAVVADVRANDGDAIRVELEHREGAVMTVLLAYKKRRFGRGVEYGGLSAGTAERRVW